jgi:hypothetical protein
LVRRQLLKKAERHTSQDVCCSNKCVAQSYCHPRACDFWILMADITLHRLSPETPSILHLVFPPVLLVPLSPHCLLISTEANREPMRNLFRFEYPNLFRNANVFFHRRHRPDRCQNITQALSRTAQDLKTAPSEYKPSMYPQKCPAWESARPGYEPKRDV